MMTWAIATRSMTAALALASGLGMAQTPTGKHESDGSMGAMRRLTTLATDADGAVWSPDSKRLMFFSSVYPECSNRPAWADEEACDKAREEWYKTVGDWCDKWTHTNAYAESK